MNDSKEIRSETNLPTSSSGTGTTGASLLPATVCRWLEMWTTTEGPQSETARKRREQIMDAAEAIITHHGIARLSLQRIEKLAGMSRGQLMYYFPNKEAILLAVYERMIRRMIQERLAAEDFPQPMRGQAWHCLHRALEDHLGLGREPTESKRELYSLLYTFLAQIAHREDYRQRLSAMYRSWREQIATDLVTSVPFPLPVDPQVVASIVQALIHGLTVQLLIDPQAFDRRAMLEACLQMLSRWYRPHVGENVPSDHAASGVGSRDPLSPSKAREKDERDYEHGDG